MEKALQEVTAALILRGDEILIAQRALPHELKGKWEFPGGKREANESLEDCLCRELREELGLTVLVENHFMSVPHPTSSGGIILIAFFAKITAGEPVILSKEHKDVIWAKLNKIFDYDLLPADRPIATALQKYRC